MKTPEILWPAIRQYKHNDNSPGFVCAFDNEETISIVNMLQTQIEDLGYCVYELRNALQQIYADRGEDQFIENICSPLIDKYRNF